MSEQQKPTLPMHPKLAALNLPPFPWERQNNSDTFCRGVYSADDWEVAYVPAHPDNRTNATMQGAHSVEERRNIGNVIATAPEMLNWMLIYRDSLQNEFSPEDYHLWVQQAQELEAIIARALGQKGGTHE